MRTLSRSFDHRRLAIVVGGVAVGACLAALIPGTVEIATAHHYTREAGRRSCKALARAVHHLLGRRHADGTRARPRGPPDPITSLAEVPKMVQDAVIATEDRSFWTNDGIDLGGVFRAFLTNVTSGEIEQGGSTITQQLVKNRILTPKRDVNRKIKEIEDALRLNEKFSKEKILVEYLNTVYFGSELLRASRRRRARSSRSTRRPFGPAASSSTSSPSARPRCSPGSSRTPRATTRSPTPTAPIRRRADVLRGMVEEGYITQAEADAANNEPLPTIKPPAEPGRRQRLPHRRGPAGPDRRSNDPGASAHTEKRTRRQGAQGRPQDLHDLRPRPAGPGRSTRPTTRKPQIGRRLGVVAGGDRPEHRRGEGDGRRARTSPTASPTSPPRPTAARPGPRSR